MYLFRGLGKLDQNSTAKCTENALCFPSVFKNTFLLFLCLSDFLSHCSLTREEECFFSVCAKNFKHGNVEMLTPIVFRSQRQKGETETVFYFSKTWLWYTSWDGHRKDWGFSGLSCWLFAFSILIYSVLVLTNEYGFTWRSLRTTAQLLNNKEFINLTLFT